MKGVEGFDMIEDRNELILFYSNNLYPSFARTAAASSTATSPPSPSSLSHIVVQPSSC